ncbi:MAG: hypothetical protein RI907_362 [Pseudomonadota bacterium]|jgi:putative oxidoreductase
MTSAISWLVQPKAPEWLSGIGPLLLRLFVAQEFVQAGWLKLGSGWAPADWFTTLQFPALIAWLPLQANWVIAGLGEIGFGLALALGLGSRLACVGLLFITWVAVYTVHFDLGWAGWNQIDTDMGQGFKVPLMLGLMLALLLTHGPGQYAIDTWIARRLHR